MSMSVHKAMENGIAVLKIDNPPVNALSARSGLVAELIGAIEAGLSDDAVRGIVIAGEGKFFSAGADISDFGEDAASDVADIRKLMAMLEAAPRPVVAAIHGIAFGGGLELALACNARICRSGTRLGLPEVKLGILPGGGGTQRMPRLIGVEKALDLMLSGRDVDAAEALKLGLVDAVVEGDPVAAAQEKAAALAANASLPRASDKSAGSMEEHAAIFTAARAKAAKGGPTAMAQSAIIDCVEAACKLPLEEGLRFEMDAFAKLMVSEPSRALRHVFFLERKLGKLPGLPAPRDFVRRIAVIGSGTMGIGITIAALNAGYEVVLVDKNPEACPRAVGNIEKTINGLVEKGRIGAEVATERLARLQSTSDLADTASADLFIEAVFEDLEVKRQVFREIEKVAKSDAILATNTSTLDVDRIAEVVATPERVVGMHFFSPANIMRLLEIIRATKTDPQVLSDVLAVSRKLGKVGVVSGICDGFIGNRIFEEYLRQAYFLLEEGALPAQIDAAMEKWGFAMGPLKVMDLAGQDIGWNIRKRRAVEQPDRPYSKLPDMICEKGRFGQKTGAGFYLYPEGSRAAVVDPEIDAMIVAHSGALGIERRQISDEEIVERCLFAMINEGARILEEGIAARPLDIDAVWLNGYGLSAARGGQMFYADRIGLDTVLAGIERFRAGYQGWAWEPSPLLVRLVQEGRDFDSMNG
jgi:3-hydroxyacyl-CoA dehydrogenase